MNVTLNYICRLELISFYVYKDLESQDLVVLHRNVVYLVKTLQYKTIFNIFVHFSDIY